MFGPLRLHATSTLLTAVLVLCTAQGNTVDTSSRYSILQGQDTTVWSSIPSSVAIGEDIRGTVVVTASGNGAAHVAVCTSSALLLYAGTTLQNRIDLRLGCTMDDQQSAVVYQPGDGPYVAIYDEASREVLFYQVPCRTSPCRASSRVRVTTPFLGVYAPSSPLESAAYITTTTRITKRNYLGGYQWERTLPSPLDTLSQPILSPDGTWVLVSYPPDGLYFLPSQSSGSVQQSTIAGHWLSSPVSVQGDPGSPGLCALMYGCLAYLRTSINNLPQLIVQGSTLNNTVLVPFDIVYTLTGIDVDIQPNPQVMSGPYPGSVLVYTQVNGAAGLALFEFNLQQRTLLLLWNTAVGSIGPIYPALSFLPSSSSSSVMLLLATPQGLSFTHITNTTIGKASAPPVFSTYALAPRPSTPQDSTGINQGPPSVVAVRNTTMVDQVSYLYYTYNGVGQQAIVTPLQVNEPCPLDPQCTLPTPSACVCHSRGPCVLGVCQCPTTTQGPYCQQQMGAAIKASTPLPTMYPLLPSTAIDIMVYLTVQPWDDVIVSATTTRVSDGVVVSSVARAVVFRVRDPSVSLQNFSIPQPFHWQTPRDIGDYTVTLFVHSNSSLSGYRDLVLSIPCRVSWARVSHTQPPSAFPLTVHRGEWEAVPVALSVQPNDTVIVNVWATSNSIGDFQFHPKKIEIDSYSPVLTVWIMMSTNPAYRNQAFDFQFDFSKGGYDKVSGNDLNAYIRIPVQSSWTDGGSGGSGSGSGRKVSLSLVFSVLAACAVGIPALGAAYWYGKRRRQPGPMTDAMRPLYPFRTISPGGGGGESVRGERERRRDEETSRDDDGGGIRVDGLGPSPIPTPVPSTTGSGSGSGNVSPVTPVPANGSSSSSSPSSSPSSSSSSSSPVPPPQREESSSSHGVSRKTGVDSEGE